tara:strand:- start:2895 stop:3179 length:285 start_codon:yes stop_codon:yes gene_type:complete
MKGHLWNIHIGGQQVSISSPAFKIDAVEACTRAIELLHSAKIDYSIGPVTLAECDGDSTMVKSDIALANAGKFSQCEKLRALIQKYNSKLKKKH